MSNSSLWLEAAEKYRPTIPMGLSEYLDNYFYLSPDATNSDGAWESLPYQARLCFLMQDLDMKRLAIQKCAQIGYTQLLRGMVGYECAHRGRNTCVWQPTSADAREFSNLQIKAMLRDCPEISKHLRVDHEKKDTDNTTSRRVWDKAVSYFRGSKSANEFRRISIDSGFVDEIDGTDATIEGEGSADSLAWSRMYASSRPKLICGSTPTISGESNIERLCNEIEEKFHNWLPCAKCGVHQQLEWGGSDADYGITFLKKSDHYKSSRTAVYVCKHCSNSFGYESLREIDEAGELRSKSVAVTNSGRIYDVSTGKNTETPIEAAVYLNGLISYTITWSDGVYQFLKATDAARRGDNSNLVTFTNEYFGEPYTPIQNKDLATWESLKGRQNESELIPSWVSHLTQWADVQKDSIHNLLVGWGEGERSICLRYDIVPGDPASGGLIDWVYENSLKQFEREDHVWLPISLSGIDSGYLADTVYNVCKRDPLKLIPTKGLSVYGKPVIEMPNRPTQNRVYLSGIGTDTAKDIIAERIKIDTETAGSIEYAAHAGINDDFFKSCTSNIKKIVYRSGKGVSRWVLQSGKNDEGLDCLSGNLGMVRLLQDRYGVELGINQLLEETDENDLSIEEMAALARA